MNFKKFTILVFASAVFFSAIFALADTGAVLSLKPSAEILSVGSDFSVQIFVDSDQPINAYSFDVIYPSDKLDVASLNEAGSVVDLWQSKPKVFVGGKIKFSGGSFSPFTGSNGLVYTVTFRAIREGEASIGFGGESYVYLANGKGTKIAPSLKGVNVDISGEGGGSGFGASSTAERKTDFSPPSINNFLFVGDPVSPDQKLVGFLVRDDKSGTKNVFIKFKQWLWWEDWEEAVNPMPVPNTAWAVRIRAVDNQGNVSEELVYDWAAFLRYLLPILLIAVFLVALVINRILKRKTSIIK